MTPIVRGKSQVKSRDLRQTGRTRVSVVPARAGHPCRQRPHRCSQPQPKHRSKARPPQLRTRSRRKWATAALLAAVIVIAGTLQPARTPHTQTHRARHDCAR